MSCEPPVPCGPALQALGLVAPVPGESPLRRRVGEYDSFARDLIAQVESELVDGGLLGRDWDVEGDPLASTLVGLWAYVAEIVAAYSELTAAEAYLSTASDWTDLSRVAGLVGYRPRPPVAAQGWVRVVVDKGADPLLPAGTRVQAPGTPQRAAQTFEVAQDTQLYSDWNQLTATWVPVSVLPDGRRVRFLGDPGFRTGDRVLFVEENLPVGNPCGDPPDPGAGSPWDLGDWLALLAWLTCMSGLGAPATALAIATVAGREDELGTALVEFDRDLDGILSSSTAAYAAYRVEQTAGEARRLSNVLQVTETDVTAPPIDDLYVLEPSSRNAETGSLILDAALETVSRDQTVAIVDWASGKCDVVPVKAHTPVTWEVTPGTPTRASKLELDTADPLATFFETGPLTAYVVDRRVLARHYEFPQAPTGATATQLRLYPAPQLSPDRIAVKTSQSGGPVWEVLACRDAAVQETVESATGEEATVGRIVDLVDGPPQGDLVQAPASANLALVRHGTTARAVLGGGDATQAGQSFLLPDAPIASDVDAAGSLVPTLVVSVDGLRWTQVPSLYGAGPAEVFVATLDAGGGETVEFGDGEQGARLPTGRGSVASTYRVGGGTAGEVESSAISSLLGSVRGVKKVEGAGPTSGGADQDDERDLRKLAPARARAFGRAVSAEDLVDLSRGYPGVSHAAAWVGSGPPGCACAGSGLHLAFMRAGTAGPRAPDANEIVALAGFLDARRDATVPLCVCAALVTSPAVRLDVVLAVDPRREVPEVVAAATAALLDPDGPLAPPDRALGQPLDRSDVYAVLHAVTGVVGVTSLGVPGATDEVGRRAAARFELIVLDPEPTVGGASA
jgi:predicted phage baseplate assembly protein